MTRTSGATKVCFFSNFPAQEESALCACGIDKKMLAGSAKRIGLAAAPIALFVVLTCGMMWPQIRHIGDSAVPHQDVYFNMWRLQWIAHALSTSPGDLFNGNIFYPEPRTLAFSDAMLVQGAIAAPLIWLGTPPVLLHNLMMLGAIVLSAVATFALVCYLTGSRGAGVLAGTIFAFAPYRFEHIMHMELQWTMWIPLAFLALHRTLDRPSIRHGLATGAAVALQVLSSIYYGIFLATLLPLFGLVLQLGNTRTSVRRVMVPLAAGAILAIALVGPYARPYLLARDRVGERPADQIRTYAARPADYMVVPRENWLYGRWETRGEGERRLFPGAVACLLAVAAVFLRRPSRLIIVYVVAAAAAFEASLGLRGYSYTFLHEYVPVFRGLRAPARLGIFVVFFLAVLAGFGYTFFAAALRTRNRVILLLALLSAVLLEDFTSISLVTYPNTAPPVYRLLASQPTGVVAEFPMVRPGHNARYEYLSIFHWKPLLNGYSGFSPPAFDRRLQDLRRFPDPFSIRVLRRADVRYVLVHESGWGDDREQYDRALSTFDADEGLRKLGAFGDGEGNAVLYELR
jgi:hypothetical protein